MSSQAARVQIVRNLRQMAITKRLPQQRPLLGDSCLSLTMEIVRSSSCCVSQTSLLWPALEQENAAKVL